MSAKILTEALVSYFHQATSTSIDAPTASIDAETESSRLLLENKYFTASVLLKDISTVLMGTTKAKEDGVILVFDALQSNPSIAPKAGGCNGATFDSLMATHEQAERNNSCGDLLRLCVGVSLGDYSPEELRGKSPEKEYSQRILWCLDHGYEYIEADLSQDGQAKGHDQRDKDGFARIVEAIQGTVWSSALVSAAKSKELRGSYDHGDKHVMEDTTTSAREEKEGGNNENPYQPPDSSLFQPTSDSKDTNTTNNNNEMDEKHRDTVAVAAADSLLDPKLVNAFDMAQLREDAEAEKIFAKMEGLLKEASQIRAASKNGTMSDTERRERAGEVALGLVESMRQFGMDEDDDSEGSDSDDDPDLDAVATQSCN